VAKGDEEGEKEEKKESVPARPSVDGQNRNASFMYFLFAKSQEPGAKS
jgi:hypothetical protein